MLDSLNSIYVLPYFWALFVAGIMWFWKREKRGEPLFYDALTLIAMLLTALVVINLFIAVKIGATSL
jgi:hypothetical protein